MDLHSDQAEIFSILTSFFIFTFSFSLHLHVQSQKATDIAKVKEKSFSYHQIFYAVIKE